MNSGREACFPSATRCAGLAFGPGMTVAAQEAIMVGRLPDSRSASTIHSKTWRPLFSLKHSNCSTHPGLPPNPISPGRRPEGTARQISTKGFDSVLLCPGSPQKIPSSTYLSLK
jgi:hypothetical protein